MRLIDADELKKDLKNNYIYYGETQLLDDFYKALNEQPTIQAVPQWIPVSERLPEPNVWVLVTVEQNGNRYQEIMRGNKYIEAWTDNINNYTDEITAWMPLPEPYKAEKEIANE